MPIHRLLRGAMGAGFALQLAAGTPLGMHLGHGGGGIGHGAQSSGHEQRHPPHPGHTREMTCCVGLACCGPPQALSSPDRGFLLGALPIQHASLAPRVRTSAVSSPHLLLCPRGPPSGTTIG